MNRDSNILILRGHYSLRLTVYQPIFSKCGTPVDHIIPNIKFYAGSESTYIISNTRIESLATNTQKTCRYTSDSLLTGLHIVLRYS